MFKVINNNLWSPVPWNWGCGGHHSCGGNSWMNKLFGYQMMFGMMNNMSNMFRSYATPPQQSYSPYSQMGLQLAYGGGGAAVPQNYEEYLQQQQDKQDFAQLKGAYTGFKFTNIGGEYQARLTSNPGVRFSGSTPLELMEAMDEYIDEHPEDFKAEPAPKKDKVDTPDKPDEVDRVDNEKKVEDADEVTPASIDDGKGDAPGNKRKVKEGWYSADRVQSPYLKEKLTQENLAKCKNAAGAIAEYLITDWKCTDIDKAKLKEIIITQNKSVFHLEGENKGKLLDAPKMDRLDLPTYKWAQENCAKEASAQPAADKDWAYSSTGQCTSESERHIKYKGTQNRIRQKNGKSSIDDDAIFTINGKQYTIICVNDIDSNGKAKNLDYFEITGQRSLGADFTLIHPETGKFNNTKADMSWTQTNKNNGRQEPKNFRLLPTNGGTYIEIFYKNGQVYMKQGDKEYLADDIMSGKHKF